MGDLPNNYRMSNANEIFVFLLLLANLTHNLYNTCSRVYYHCYSNIQRRKDGYMISEYLLMSNDLIYKQFFDSQEVGDPNYSVIINLSQRISGRP